MAETKEQPVKTGNTELEAGTYEILRTRLQKSEKELRNRLDSLNNERKNVFGKIENQLVATERITTEHNCIPKDIFSLGKYFLFGYNVMIGLKNEIDLSDVFSIYEFKDLKFHACNLDMIRNDQFLLDFRELYKYYKLASFEKFFQTGPYLHLVFKIGKNENDFKTFKFLIKDSDLIYQGNRSDQEYKFPPKYDFEWKRTSRDYHRGGKHPHVSVLDKVFIETIGGDLTIKVEDNTESGEGIYSEPVEDKDQKLDDAEMYYADLGNILLLKIKPFNEKDFRYIVYNQKIRTARRIDAIKDSCMLLPDMHGIIFSKGFYLQTGEYKVFDNELQGLIFERKIHAANGEDFLYVFYSREHASYILLPYNIISQSVENFTLCNGYSIFPDGELVYINTQKDPSKSHVVQIWKTPFVGADYIPPVIPDSYLYKIGNKEIVRAMADCTELLNLLNKNDEVYANLYLDLVKKSNDTIDTYFWLKDKQTFNLAEPLAEIGKTAAQAIEEFEKVVRIKKNTREQIKKCADQYDELNRKIRKSNFESVDEFVSALSDLRILRGELIGAKDLKYSDVPFISEIEEKLLKESDKLSNDAVKFLVNEKSLSPYLDKIEEKKKTFTKIEKYTEASAVESETNAIFSELELLIETVSNLKIEDPTQTTKIIDNISLLFSDLNSLKSAIKNKKTDLKRDEVTAEFHSQLKLTDQSIINFLDLCDSPEKCDDYLTKLVVQLEELEGKVAEFPEFLTLLAEKREQVYEAFENRKIQINEARGKKSQALMDAADRIIKGTKNKINSLKTATEINAYFASDLMLNKLRDIISELQEMKETVKADDLHGRIKKLKEESIRQLKDKEELLAGGDNIIKFGTFKFSVNTQPIDITMVQRDDAMFYHITGTGFFEKVSDTEFNNTKAVWNQLLISENEHIYRAEYLAYFIFGKAKSKTEYTTEEILKKGEEELVQFVQKIMLSRYSEGYVKGVHDKDAALILRNLCELDAGLHLIRYSPESRAVALFVWTFCIPVEERNKLSTRLKGLGIILSVFPETDQFREIKEKLRKPIQDFILTNTFGFFADPDEAADYLFNQIIDGEEISISQEANELVLSLNNFLKKKNLTEKFQGPIGELQTEPEAQFDLIINWLSAYVQSENLQDKNSYIIEAGILLLLNDRVKTKVIKANPTRIIKPLHGNHSKLQSGELNLNFIDFRKKLNKYFNEQVPSFEKYTQKKNLLVQNFKEELELESFKSKVLSSFVRNKLIDEVYLPLIGANLAKQIGVTGENKRTDQMGMLLLISPPGYGKTTLMEYVADRLGIIFMKINGPSIGHKITSVDPSEATNAAAREELEKLNLAFEMGDNVMIYIDDIQHCNPEFLQKFISLCDGQRKIEGVYKGKSKTYDFKGKKVCVVMAGNPYTESGEKFKIPDMLANRADTYNLGDIIGDKENVFKLSYIENCLTSNQITARVAAKSAKDIHTFLKLVETGDQTGLDLEGNYAPEEINEIVSILKRLLVLREVVLKVNLEYIASASQADEFRTEPAFKLQGSYRNMNKMAEKIHPIMNDNEFHNLILSHYENESQTLTTGAEANLLKFKEINGWMNEKEKNRWEEIKTTFRKNQKLKGIDLNNQMGHLLAQLTTLTDGVEGIKQAIEKRGS